MKSGTTKRPLRVGLISLGCAKNLVDAEIMLGSLLQSGLEITNDASAADVLIVNTCSFIDAAQEESVDTILESAYVRDARQRGQALIVSGCLPQRFRDELPKLLPEVDAFMGIDQVTQVGEIVRAALARRAERINGCLRSPVPSSKSNVVRRLGEVDKQRDAAPHAGGASLRGAEGFGKTKSANGNSSAWLRARPRPSSSSSNRPAREREDEGRGRFATDEFRTDFETGIDASAQSARSNLHRAASLVDVTLRPTYVPDYATPRFRLTPRHFAYVKIAEGCNHPCSFCIIPRLRGAHRSRPQSDVVQEARQLLADGVKELNLISQDTTFYGLDLRRERRGYLASPEKFTAAAGALPASATTLCTLLRELNGLPGDFWIRLLYTHPAHWTDAVIDTLAACPKVARYVDMPLQHIHDNMLERMRRETSRQYIVDLIAKIRARLPGITLRTTFIVGFPGETEACFQELLAFIRETKFERLGVFTYSQEDGTRAGKMADQIPDRLKEKRRDLAMAAQHEVARQVSASFVGRTIPVLVEKKASAGELSRANLFSWEHGLIRATETRNAKLGTRNFFVARGEADAPDIDGRIYVRGQLPVGEFARVNVLGHSDYDLIAEPA